MRRSALLFALVLGAALFLWAQQRGPSPVYTPFEVKAIFPREHSPGLYNHVSAQEIDRMASEGWELVSVMPYIYRNEERGDPAKMRPVVTQTYPAYFFKRQKILFR